MWRFLPLIFLPASEPGRSETPLFGTFHALTVDDRGGGRGFPLPAQDIKRMMDGLSLRSATFDRANGSAAHYGQSRVSAHKCRDQVDDGHIH